MERRERNERAERREERSVHLLRSNVVAPAMHDAVADRVRDREVVAGELAERRVDRRGMIGDGFPDARHFVARQRSLSPLVRFEERILERR